MLLLLVVLVRWVFLDGVLDVVELLAGGDDAVVQGVVVLGGGSQRGRGRLRADAGVGALLPPPPHAPQQHGDDGQRPHNDHRGNQQGHQVV